MLYIYGRWVSCEKKQQEGALSVVHGRDEVKTHKTWQRG